MKTSLETAFRSPATDTAALAEALGSGNAMARLRHALGESDFDTAYDFFRNTAAQMAERGEGDKAAQMISQADALILRAGAEEGHLLNVHFALMQILTALHIEAGRTDQAMRTAAATLTLLAQEPRRRDQPFLQVLAALLYDISLLHAARGEYRQAEREVEKSNKIYERLARQDADRYGAAHLMALNAATGVYRSRVRQAEMLAHAQASTTLYLQMMSQGVGDAATRLIDSLATEGQTLAEMGRHREAVQYYTRALRYLTKIEPEASRRQLELSVALGESMLNVKAMRDKGVHLLNTMLHKSLRANAMELHARVADDLEQARSRSLDILGLWHKLFPR